MDEKTQLTHPEGKKAISMDTAKYSVLKKTLMSLLKKKHSLTHKEIGDAITAEFKQNKIAFEGSLLWHLEWVKLDLEANQIIQRDRTTTPATYHLIV